MDPTYFNYYFLKQIIIKIMFIKQMDFKIIIKITIQFNFIKFIYYYYFKFMIINQFIFYLF